MLKVGTKVQDFSLLDAENKLHTLSDYRGKKVVIYFYPKDLTSGCTTQACAFRDTYDEFKKNNIVVIGISKDSVKSHKKFVETYDLPFILLSDEDIKVCSYFGVYVEKSMYGRKYMGVNRSTFILDEEGIITHVFEKASPKENAAEILKVLI
ncbi:thioredoxin-dependent thiol peroxidase [Mariniplasma anaerobium]|uniref:thioredoxin-dependent peroxiredoxin n=1 Tax=Mariniplasma anaerobium TaxID=2735436 RepID=A0A7U9THL4_9MOLU|nr:thioredoxin-dependent thiol peroxidase [Mariniplasma anaerobium]BCR36590.1 peroxiredoxin [Mariniplasma anaerobium]